MDTTVCPGCAGRGDFDGEDCTWCRGKGQVPAELRPHIKEACFMRLYSARPSQLKDFVGKKKTENPTINFSALEAAIMAIEAEYQKRGRV